MEEGPRSIAAAVPIHFDSRFGTLFDVSNPFVGARLAPSRAPLAEGLGRVCTAAYRKCVNWTSMKERGRRPVSLSLVACRST